MKAIRFTFYGYWVSAGIGYGMQAYNGSGNTFLLLAVILLAINIVQSITALFRLRKVEVFIYLVISIAVISYLLYQNAEANKLVA